MGNRAQDLWIEPRVWSQLLGIRSLSEIPRSSHVRRDHFVAQFLKVLVGPDRVRARFGCDPHRRQIGKPLLAPQLGWYAALAH
jgi:hypothetical protein